MLVALPRARHAGIDRPSLSSCIRDCTKIILFGADHLSLFHFHFHCIVIKKDMQCTTHDHI